MKYELPSMESPGDPQMDVLSVDLNPLILRGADPIVVDALVEIDGAST